MYGPIHVSLRQAGISLVGTLTAPNIYTKTEVNGLLATKAGTSYVDASIAALLAQDPVTLTSLVVNGYIGLANSAYINSETTL